MSKPNRVCHITTVHPPNNIRIFHKECVSLARCGYEVTLLAANCKSETSNGVRIKGIQCAYRSKPERIMKVPWMLYKEAVKIDADLYHFHDPDFLPYSRQLVRKRKKVIYDVHEDVPRDILSKPWLPRVTRKVLAELVERFEDQVVKRLTSIVAATPAIRDRFIPFNNSTIDIRNYPMADEFTPLPWRERRDEICYAGTIMPIFGIDNLIDSLNYTSGIRLNLAGWYSPTSYRKTLCQKKGWSHVNEFGSLGRKDVARVIERSKAGIVTILPEERHMNSLPTKMFEYMAAGVAVIASDFPLLRKIIEKHDCGICVNPLDPRAIAEAINYVTSNEEVSIQMGVKGRRAVEKNYNWTTEFRKLTELYDSI